MRNLSISAAWAAGALTLLIPSHAQAQGRTQAEVSPFKDTATCKLDLNDNRGVLRDLRVSEAPGNAKAPDKTPGGELSLAVQTPNVSASETEPAPMPEPASYFKIEIQYTPCGRSDERDYNKEGRDWLARFLLHKVADKILTVKATIRPLGVNATKPLASIVRDSGSKGETWTTNIENSAILLPYFRADQDSFATIDISFDSKRQYQGAGIAGQSLDIITRAAALISPTSSLITKANKDRFNDAATFVDTTIAGFLRVDINENVHLDVPLAPNETLATITLFAPGANDPYYSPAWPDEPIGQWTLKVVPLSGSIFEQEPNAQVLAASVMNFRVTEDKTLKAALTESNNVQLARDALLKGDKSQSGDLAVGLCRATAIEADQQGFSHEDVGKVVWAYLADLALPGGSSKDGKRTKAIEACKRDLEYFWEQPAKKTDGAPAPPKPQHAAKSARLNRKSKAIA